MTGPVVVHPTGSPEYKGILRTIQGAQTLVSILIMRLGGKVVITPEEFLAVNGTIFMESDAGVNTGHPDHERLAVWVEAGPQSPAAANDARVLQ